jgi:hypothetical protein
MLSVYLYDPSNKTKQNTLSCVTLHVSTSGSHRQAFLRARKLQIQWWSAHGIAVLQCGDRLTLRKNLN